MKNRKHRTIGDWMLMGIGLLVAALIGGAFYLLMAYELAGTEAQDAAQGSVVLQTPAPLAGDPQGADLFPGKRLALPEEYAIAEDAVARDVLADGTICRVIEQTYTLADGTAVGVISATPAEYIVRLSEEGWTPQLLTGYTLAGLEAVLEEKDGRHILAARDGELIYMLESEADAQTMYTLGSMATLEE